MIRKNFMLMLNVCLVYSVNVIVLALCSRFWILCFCSLAYLLLETYQLFVQCFDLERWWRLFQKRFLHIKLSIYVFIYIFLCMYILYWLLIVTVTSECKIAMLDLFDILTDAKLHSSNITFLFSNYIIQTNITIII
jgi:hypothetical protein